MNVMSPEWDTPLFGVGQVRETRFMVRPVGTSSTIQLFVQVDRHMAHAAEPIFDYVSNSMIYNKNYRILPSFGNLRLSALDTSEVHGLHHFIAYIYDMNIQRQQGRRGAV